MLMQEGRSRRHRGGSVPVRRRWPAGLRRWQHAVLRCTKVGDDPWLGRTGSVRPNGPGEW
jgi:hypothetical protein